MFKNYLLVTFRNLLKNRVFTLINILGLGIALSVCIVAFFNQMFNYEFDRQNVNFDKIYRINSFRDMKGREQEYGVVPATLGLMAKKEIPGIEKSARLARSGSPVKRGVDLFPSEISYVDPEFLDIFTFPILLGDRKSIDNQGNVLLSRKMATTLFGNDFPVGKSISIFNDKNKEFTYTVGGVFADCPDNSSFRIDILIHFDNFLLMWDVKDADWKFNTAALFIQIPDKSALQSIIQSLKNYIPVQNEAREDFKINRFTLVPLKEVGSNSRVIWSSSLFPALHPAAVISPPVMALFILLIACFNFANTSISTFSKRLKEIGLRKTFGGQRRQLVLQFMFETIIICTFALFAAIVFAEFLVPAYSSLWSYMSIELTFSRYVIFWLFLVLLLLLTGFIAGVYPALYVSSFSPVNLMKGGSPFRGSGKLSSILLLLQFTISIMALVMGIVFAKNARYQETLDLGYDRKNIIVVPIPPVYYSSYRNEILSNPKIIAAEGTQYHIGFGGYRRPVKDEVKQLEVDVMDIGPLYSQTMGLHLTAGRLFDQPRVSADRSNGSIIVNQKLVDNFGWKDPVGHIVTFYDTTKFTVIGVVKDFYLRGIWQKVEPVIMRLSGSDLYSIMAVRASEADLPGVLEDLNLKWKSMGINNIFDGMVQENTMREGKDINSSIMKVNIFLAVTATLLSLIGMYNLVSLDVLRRTKEMGIRKIQGASVPLNMYLVSKKFLIVLVIASLLGCAGGYYMSNMLMGSIWEYFVQIKAGVLILSASIMSVATILTIIFKIAKAALRNPVDSLRYE
jgi:ABC-type antimicrobial peptide transport system permease subunit